MINCIFVGAGGFIGAVLRYIIGLIPLKTTEGFPVTTLAVNILGAFAIGLIATLVAKSGNIDSRYVLFLKTGLCGGFTTFSTFSLETLQLFQNGKTALGILYIALSIIFCIGAVWLAQTAVAK